MRLIVRNGLLFMCILLGIAGEMFIGDIGDLMQDERIHDYDQFSECSREEGEKTYQGRNWISHFHFDRLLHYDLV